ncbi:MAG: YcgN family cysteine cluster protein [Alphaproteobacteria bacterium]|nr:YcgN family cysteine cluster protein [Alphaproteobacteria bacterium]
MKPSSREKIAEGRFWEEKSLSEMTPAEWEALCDGCALCCLIKLEDEDTGATSYTDIVCQLLDEASCRCSDYPNRSARVPGCVRLTPETIAEAAPWMPPSCAYRRLHEGRALPDWHPLVTGDKGSVAAAGCSVRGRVVCETAVPEAKWPDRVVAWPRRVDRAKFAGRWRRARENSRNP